MGVLGQRWTLIAVVLTLGSAAMYLHLSVVSSAQLLSVAYSDEPVRYDDGYAGDNIDDVDDEEVDNGNGGDDDDAHDDHEPYVDRWQRRFASKSGSVFFKHIRKAAGSMIRQFMFRVFDHHGQGTFRQFLENNDRKEVERHFPFFSRRQIEKANIYFNETKREERAKPINRVFYVEQEFTTMDWQCQDVDPRWNDSISIIVMRHPIERHLSEFFYTGPPATDEFEGIQFGRKEGGGLRGLKRLKVDPAKLYVNKTYTHMLSMFIQENLQPWAINKETNREAEKYYDFKWYFRPRYIDNFQLRSLAGCAAGECPGVDPEALRKMAKDQLVFKNETAASIIESTCTSHPFYTHKGSHGAALRRQKVGAPCGPCFHRAAAWGPVGADRLGRAVRALKGFDVVLLAETLDDPDQLALLTDVMGVPRNTSLSIPRKNINVVKRTRREKTHYYRDLVSNLTYPFLVNSLVEENALEIELYEHAVRLNRQMTERWKKEVQWSDNDVVNAMEQTRKKRKRGKSAKFRNNKFRVG